MDELKTGIRENNKFLLSVANQFHHTDFERYTNLHDIIRTNLKLTDDFYTSKTAARIFRNIFGIKQCQVNVVRLDWVEVLVSSQDNGIKDDENDLKMKGEKVEHFSSLNVGHIQLNSNDNNKKIDPTIKNYLVASGTGNHLRISKIDSANVATNNESTNQPSEKFYASRPNPSDKQGQVFQYNAKLKNVRRNEIPESILSNSRQSNLCTIAIPYENVICHMDKSESIPYLRQYFQNHRAYVEKQFEKYIAATDPSNLSLKDFWLGFVKAEYQSEPQTLSALNFQIKIKSENIFDEVNESQLHNIEISPPPNHVNDFVCSGHLSDHLQLNDNNVHLVGPFAIHQQSVEICSNIMENLQLTVV